MNASKTEYIVFGIRPQFNKCYTQEIDVCGDKIKRQSSIKYFGVKEHVKRKCRSAMQNYIKIKQWKKQTTIRQYQMIH